jgi:hypothetical protein
MYGRNRTVRASPRALLFSLEAGSPRRSIAARAGAALQERRLWLRATL